ncbi:hypothetical protein ACFLRM_02670 [Acidobacteriota bacterium]
MRKGFWVIFCLFFFLAISVFATTELLGNLTKEEIIENFPDWQEEAAIYTPKSSSIEKLKSIDRIINIEIFLGTWCPDSKEHSSSYFKITESVDNPFFISDFIGIPRDNESRQPYIQGKNIIKVPTFIVIIDGQEIGRIIEHPEESIEEDLINIISSTNF